MQPDLSKPTLSTVETEPDIQPPKNLIDFMEDSEFDPEHSETLAERRAANRKLRNNLDFTWIPHVVVNFDKTRLDTIVFLAKALSKQEILDYFGIVDTLNRVELVYFNFAFNKGKSQGKREAMEKLFISMSDRNGGMQALKYLQTHAERFPDDDNSGPGTSASDKFKFTVDLSGGGKTDKN